MLIIRYPEESRATIREMAEETLTAFDLNKDGKVSIEALLGLGLTVRCAPQVSVEEAVEASKAVDRLQSASRMGDRRRKEAFLKAVDLDGDGMISMAEYAGRQHCRTLLTTTPTSPSLVCVCRVTPSHRHPTTSAGV